MIISASRRTDIPSYYSDWFFRRISEGYVLVRNPMNNRQVSRVKLSADTLDGIVLWTKNPLPMIGRLRELKVPFYFQFTLNSYAKDVEPHIPSKNDVIIPAFQKLSRLIGRERVVWRYDPILLNDTYTVGYHLKYFALLARKLRDYTESCTFSFIDFYRNTRNNTKFLDLQIPRLEDKLVIAEAFGRTARDYGLKINTCAEELDLSHFGVGHATCVDGRLLERIGGCKLNTERDRNQRIDCGCAASIDIGMYDSCRSGCLYCYANRSLTATERHFHNHDPASPLLYGRISADDRVTERQVFSYRESQKELFG